MGRRGKRTETVTGRVGQRGRHAGVNGEQARQARAGGDRETWGPLVGHVPQYRASYE